MEDSFHLSFQQQYVFTLDEFPAWIMKRSRDLLLQCIDNVDQVTMLKSNISLITNLQEIGPIRNSLALEISEQRSSIII